MLHGERTLRYLLETGGIQPFLDDQATTEVVINKPEEIGVERGGKWSWHDADLSFDRLDAIGILAAAMTSRDVDSHAAAVHLDASGRRAYPGLSAAGDPAGPRFNDHPQATDIRTVGGRSRLRAAVLDSQQHIVAPC